MASRLDTQFPKWRWPDEFASNLEALYVNGTIRKITYVKSAITSQDIELKRHFRRTAITNWHF